MQHPTEDHYFGLLHTISYVAHTLHHGVLLRGSNVLHLRAYSDSDWGACIDTRRSVTGYVLLFGDSPISWRSKKQSTVSRSSSEAEYRAFAAAASEVTWIVRLLEELGVTNLKPVTLFCDNKSALRMAHNPVLHDRTKHIEIDCHFTREKVMDGLLQLTYLPTSSQLADVFTKILPSSHFQTLLAKLGMCSTPQVEGGC